MTYEERKIILGQFSKRKEPASYFRNELFEILAFYLNTRTDLKPLRNTVISFTRQGCFLCGAFGKNLTQNISE